MAFAEYWRTHDGSVRRVDQRLAADDCKCARRFRIAGRSANAVQLSSLHSSPAEAWNDSTSLISALSLAAWRLIAAISRASRRACARPSTKSRRICSMNDERETFGPAILSRVASRSWERVREVLAFILRRYYCGRILSREPLVGSAAVQFLAGATERVAD